MPCPITGSCYLFFESMQIVTGPSMVTEADDTLWTTTRRLKRPGETVNLLNLRRLRQCQKLAEQLLDHSGYGSAVRQACECLVGGAHHFTHIFDGCSSNLGYDFLNLGLDFL